MAGRPKSSEANKMPKNKKSKRHCISLVDEDMNIVITNYGKLPALQGLTKLLSEKENVDNKIPKD